MKKKDIILLCVILSLALAISCVFFLFYRGRGDVVVVRVSGEEYARLPLSEDAEFTIDGVGGTNLLVIKDGKAFISEASCPDHICVRTGAASELKTIVCIPNEVTVSIEEKN